MSVTTPLGILSILLFTATRVVLARAEKSKKVKKDAAKLPAGGKFLVFESRGGEQRLAVIKPNLQYYADASSRVPTDCDTHKPDLH